MKLDEIGSLHHYFHKLQISVEGRIVQLINMCTVESPQDGHSIKSTSLLDVQSIKEQNECLFYGQTNVFPLKFFSLKGTEMEKNY